MYMYMYFKLKITCKAQKEDVSSTELQIGTELESQPLTNQLFNHNNPIPPAPGQRGPLCVVC